MHPPHAPGQTRRVVNHLNHQHHPRLVTFFSCAFMMSTNNGVHTATAAARRRQRRLRSWLRHERMTVAMTLAEKLHHTSRGQKLARVGEEVVHDAHDAPRGPMTPPPGERHPAGARAAAKRPHRAALRRGRPADPRPARSGRVGRRGRGCSHPRLPHDQGVG